MIPSDVVSRLQLAADAAITRTPPAQQVTDALADLVPGQRVFAEIQALLPNGAYRALVNQRDITLALPFSAKAGDALELEVVDNDGKLALALVARRSEQDQSSAGGERPAVETTLSRTGNFIAGLFTRGEEGEQAKPALLNANQPIAQAPPTKAADLIPLLKQAISQSGMFYESQQSQWIGNMLPIEKLLTQPQGRLSPVLHTAAQATGNEQESPASMPASEAVRSKNPESTAIAASPPPAAQNNVTELAAAKIGLSAAQPVAPDLLPIVQQQLEALATQTYVWQGLAWPGQPMQWEIIEENGGQQRQDGETDPPPWQTRLTLSMPQLGEVRAALRISAGELTLSLSAQSNAAASQLTNGSDILRNQLEAAGLKLNGFTVGRHDQPTE